MNCAGDVRRNAYPARAPFDLGFYYASIAADGSATRSDLINYRTATAPLIFFRSLLGMLRDGGEKSDYGNGLWNSFYRFIGVHVHLWYVVGDDVVISLRWIGTYYRYFDQTV